VPIIAQFRLKTKQLNRIIAAGVEGVFPNRRSGLGGDSDRKIGGWNLSWSRIVIIARRCVRAILLGLGSTSIAS